MREKEKDRERERKRERERERERGGKRKRKRALPPVPNLLSSFSWLYLYIDCIPKCVFAPTFLTLCLCIDVAVHIHFHQVLKSPKLKRK